VTRISVCIATVGAATIRTAIASILGQTWADWELIVVGQGHRDELETTVSAASNGERRVRYVHSDRMGLSVAPPYASPPSPRATSAACVSTPWTVGACCVP